MTEFDSKERRGSYQGDGLPFQNEPELEKLVEGAVRASRLQRAFEERLKARMRAREEEAELKAETAKLAYEKALESLDAIRQSNARLELRSANLGSNYESSNFFRDISLMEEETLGISDEAHGDNSKVTLARLRKSSLIPRFQGRMEKDGSNYQPVATQ